MSSPIAVIDSSATAATNAALPNSTSMTPIPPRPRSQLSLMSLPNECLTLLVQWVSRQGVQDLFPLLCVNKRLFYLVVPILYRDPFRLSARCFWKRSVYKGMIERQTKLIRTLLLCCTRTINTITPVDPEAEKKDRSGFWSAISLGRAVAAVRRGDKETLEDSARTVSTGTTARIAATQYENVSVQGSGRQGAYAPSLSSTSRRNTLGPRSLSSASTRNVGNRNNEGTGMSQTTTSQGLERREGDRSYFRSLFLKLGNAHRDGQNVGDMSKNKDGSQLKPQSHLTKIEKIPIIWDGEKQEPEARRIPGLGRPNSTKLKFPPELTKTIIRLANEPPPMVNYLSYVTHTDVRSWSAASNMTLVHQILGDARPSWRARLQGFVKKTSRRIMGKQSTPDGQGITATVTGPIYESRHDADDFDEEAEDGLEAPLSFRHNARYRRWRQGRGNRNKNLWELRDVDFLELLLLFYTSTKIGSLSLRMNCSHWYHPSLNVLIPGIPEQLSGLRRIVIDHADTIAHSALPVPQLFIQRHQKAFPGQLREIQVRQSYHYAYDMSKSVLQTIKTIDRLEVLDLSNWTGVFSGLESICTDHLRKLLICHHMDVPQPEMFDELLKRCPVLEELSIIVPHPRLFSWAVERRRDNGISAGTLAMAAATTTKTQCRKSLLSSRGASIWSDPHGRRPAYLPPLKTLTLFGHTPDVVGAFKDAIFAFQDTLESIQVSMYSDMTTPSESHLEVPPPHFVVAGGNPQSQFIGVSIHQDPMQSSTGPFNAALVASQSTINPYNASPELSALWHQEILTGINVSHDPSSSSTNTPSPSTPPSYLTWNWPLPRLRTMSLGGPAVAYFDMQLLRFCPQLTDLALYYHCSRLLRLVNPSTTTSNPGTTRTLNRYPRIMVCDSLAFKWGINPQEDRHIV